MNNLFNAIVDSHCHIYPCYDIETFLKSAFENPEKIHKADRSLLRIIFLTERASENYFNGILRLNFSEYSFNQINENTIKVTDIKNLNILLIIKGMQIVSNEGIEILTIGERPSQLNKKPISFIIDYLVKERIFTILPWSFGKWMFGRKAIVDKLIDDFSSNDFFIGDIPMRDILLLEPKIMYKIKQNKYKILNGSDPLNYSGEEKLVFYGGFLTNININGKTDVVTQIKSQVEQGNYCNLRTKKDIIFALKRWSRNFLR